MIMIIWGSLWRGYKYFFAINEMFCIEIRREPLHLPSKVSQSGQDTPKVCLLTLAPKARLTFFCSF